MATTVQIHVGAESNFKAQKYKRPKGGLNPFATVTITEEKTNNATHLFFEQGIDARAFAEAVLEASNFLYNSVENPPSYAVAQIVTVQAPHTHNKGCGLNSCESA